MLGTDHAWLRHMALFNGYSDPAGIIVRPNKGLDAVAYLEVRPVNPAYARGATVFSLGS
jgi:hypothetical protein